MPKTIRPGQYRSGVTTGQQQPTYPRTPTMQAPSQSKVPQDQQSAIWLAKVGAPLPATPNIDLRTIPRIMIANGMVKGATLLFKWFTGPANSHSNAAGSEEKEIITMEWILKFPRAKAVYDAAVNGKIWQNAKAQEVLKGRFLGALGKRNEVRLNYIDVPEHARIRYSINYRTVGNPLDDPLDDLFAALGNFVFYFLLDATATRLDPGTLSIDIHRVGVCVCDSFDFEGDQFLGFWDSKTNTVSKVNFIGGTWVENRTFRTWRDQHGKGGDFMIYTDYKFVSKTDYYPHPLLLKI